LNVSTSTTTRFQATLEHVAKLEVQRRFHGESAGPVRADRRLAAEDATRNAHALDDERGAHFEVVRVVREDSLEIVRVPGRDPLGGKLAREGCVDHAHSVTL
jgi:hypothetical protein